MSARAAILGAVRAALGRAEPDAHRVASDAHALLDNLDATRPALMAHDPVEAFVARAASAKLIGTSVERIARAADFPAAVARYLTAQGLARSIVLQPASLLRSLDWGGFELRARMASDEPAGVGLARWAIAETGSLVFHSGADTPILSNFLPLHHVVLVRADTIVAYLEDYAQAFAAAGEPAPRNINLVTGASGTTDIEGVLVRGAHGPRSLHIVLADAA